MPGPFAKELEAGPAVIPCERTCRVLSVIVSRIPGRKLNMAAKQDNHDDNGLRDICRYLQLYF